MSEATEPVTATPTFTQKLTKWIIAACVLISGGIGALKLVNQFTLPSCSEERTTTTVRDIFKSKNVELVSLDNIQPVTDTAKEKTCTAHIASKDETANIDYKIYWSGWTVQVLIQTVRDEKRR